MNKNFKYAGKIIGIMLLLYVASSIGFYLLQDSIIFQPSYLPKEYTFKFEQPYNEYFINTNDGQSLNVLLFKTQQPSKGLILYFHGNADDLQRWGKYSVDFTSLGYDVLMPDYRGYGKSTGKPSELDFYNDAEVVLEWCSKNLTYNRLIIYGRSLGSAVASNLASKVNPDLLILETPFDDLHGVVYPPIKPLLWFLPLHSIFPNNVFLQQVSCRKVIFHGTDDWVVPFSSALRLKRLLSEHDQFVVIDRGGHKNLREFLQYHEALKTALQ